MMKKLLFLILFALSATVYGQNNLLVDKKIYSVVYSQKLKSPLTVSYKLYKPKSLVKRTGSFYQEKGLITATDADFKDNVYDKGHLAPAETFSDTDEHMHLTFSYLNCALQHYQLNRGVWKSLEEHERQWAYTDSLFVTNRIIFDQPLHPTKTGAFIPDYFEKEIRFMTTGIIRIYRFPNVEPISKDIDYYLVKKY